MADDVGKVGNRHPAACPISIYALGCRRMSLRRSPRPCARRSSGHRPMLPELRAGMQPSTRNRAPASVSAAPRAGSIAPTADVRASSAAVPPVVDHA
ncbi:hypothetical protein, partial [Burkholderia cenocepacia]|uniref:hypothetical protein n=1 Tax=Burkholderia cenocepacia TaxID=95486 RepID=UPI001C4DDEC5